MPYGSRLPRREIFSSHWPQGRQKPGYAFCVWFALRLERVSSSSLNCRRTAHYRIGVLQASWGAWKEITYGDITCMLSTGHAVLCQVLAGPCSLHRVDPQGSHEHGLAHESQRSQQRQPHDDRLCISMSAGHTVYPGAQETTIVPPRRGFALQRPIATEEGMTALSKGDGKPLLAVVLACMALACSRAWAAKESAAAKPAIQLPLDIESHKTSQMPAWLLKGCLPCSRQLYEQ